MQYPESLMLPSLYRQPAIWVMHFRSLFISWLQGACTEYLTFNHKFEMLSCLRQYYLAIKPYLFKLKVLTTVKPSGKTGFFNPFRIIWSSFMHLPMSLAISSPLLALFSAASAFCALHILLSASLPASASSSYVLKTELSQRQANPNLHVIKNDICS